MLLIAWETQNATPHPVLEITACWKSWPHDGFLGMSAQPWEIGHIWGFAQLWRLFSSPGVHVRCKTRGGYITLGTTRNGSDPALGGIGWVWRFFSNVLRSCDSSSPWPLSTRPVTCWPFHPQSWLPPRGAGTRAGHNANGVSTSFPICQPWKPPGEGRRKLTPPLLTWLPF